MFEFITNKIMFFYRNPLYFNFIFSRKNIKIQLALGISDDNKENLPFDIFKKTAINVFSKVNMPKKLMQDKIIAMWALVQGLVSIVTMPNVEYDDDWEVRIEKIIRAIII